jgi:hypothetical protein
MRATTWDIVCAANQHLEATGRRLHIYQFFPGRYQAISIDRQGTARPMRKIGSQMTEAQVREFIWRFIFK